MIGVVADDTTGANDVGIMLAKNGYATRVLSLSEDLTQRDLAVDAVIIDTDSRLDSPAVASDKVRRATRLLQARDCRVYWKKTCSVFRGNVGAEFDAMLDTLGADFGIAVAAFPKNGRVTRDGIHYVHGRPLAESEFQHDPVHPMRNSDLRAVLQRQTRHSVEHIALATVRQGKRAIRAALDGLRGRCRYVLVDAEIQQDLAAIAGAVADEPVLLGSSALAEELPAFWPPPTGDTGVAAVDLTDPCGIFIVAGSITPQTRAQVAAAAASGIVCLKMDSRSVLTETGAVAEVSRLVESAVPLLRRGTDVLVHSPHEPAEVAETKATGQALGLSEVAVSRAVSLALAGVTAAVVQQTGLKRLMVLGGDTAGAVTRRLGIRGNTVLAEIEPGLPSGLALGVPPLLLVLKSGSFGSPEFLSKAADHLRALSSRTSRGEFFCNRNACGAL